MKFKTWAKDAAKRAVKTAAQSAVAVLGADQAGWLHADVRAIALTALTAGIVSILQNLSNLDVGDKPAATEVVHVVADDGDPVVSTGDRWYHEGG